MRNWAEEGKGGLSGVGMELGSGEGGLQWQDGGSVRLGKRGWWRKEVGLAGTIWTVGIKADSSIGVKLGIAPIGCGNTVSI
ncbi:hypothetical protein ACH5RR_003606 [Cinchona calisaya]|uniref:Uncharacterized protein n=1 Tax=Cinchona calisaya TaxID=153742 RepID=A0ABD3AVI3_9GENT